MTAHHRAKGRQGEREVAELLTTAGFPTVRNERNSGGGEDLTHSISGLWLEVKRQERLNIRAAVKQAAAACGEKLPVVIHRGNRDEWLVTVRLKDLLARVEISERGCILRESDTEGV
jgi:Holliday junction resolvase